MARVITGDELDLLRAPGDWSRFLLAIQLPSTIYSARVNGAPASNDMVNQIEYDGGSGTLADVKVGMSLYVGTSAGARDLGELRIRKAPDADTFFFGETSKVIWADNAYLTVVDYFGIWDRPVRIVDGEAFMDSDVEYDDQHVDFDPVPVLGPHRVAKLTGADVDVALGPESGWGSWVIGSTIDSLEWSIPTATAIDDVNAVNPVATFDTPGWHACYCIANAVNGKSFEGVRWVYIYSNDSPAISAFRVKNNPTADYEGGGYSFSVDLFDDAGLDLVRDRALVILFSEDHYGETAGSLGPIEGSENQLVMGWIAGDTIDFDPETGGRVEFTVQGPQYWMRQSTKYGLDLNFALNTPDAWSVMPELTVDRGLFHLLHWRSTITKIMDVQLTGDPRMTMKLQTSATSLWEQVKDIASNKIIASPGCDRYGRMFVLIDPQVVPEADRTWPVVQSLLKKDWKDRIPVERQPNKQLAILFTSGEMVTEGGSSSSLYSLSPGHVPYDTGTPDARDAILVEDQAQSNELAGLYMGWKNNEFPRLPIEIPENNRFIDLWPHQFVAVDLDGSETPRGIPYSGNVIPRGITMFIDHDAGVVSLSLDAEGETFAAPAVDGDIPATAGGEDFDLSVPRLPGLPPLPDFSGLIYVPPTSEPENRPRTIVIATTLGVIYTENADEEDTTDIVWQFMNNGLDVNDLSQIGQMVVTPSGVIYIMTNGSAAVGYEKIMRAAGLGAHWETVFTATDRVYEGATRSVRIVGLGVNASASDQIGIVDSVDYIAFGANTTGRFYVGSTSFGAGTAFFNKYNDVEAAVLFVANKWFVFTTRPTGIGGSGSSPWLFRFSSSGAADTDANFTTGAGQGLGEYRGQAVAGKLYLWVHNGNQNGYIIANPDLTFTFYDEPTYTVDPQGVQGLAVSPTGTHAMAADDDGPFTPYKSTDSLATWASVAGVIAIGSDVWENCKDNYRWLFGGGSTGPRLTMDQGTTYVDLSGNLGYIAAARDITHIRFI